MRQLHRILYIKRFTANEIEFLNKRTAVKVSHGKKKLTYVRDIERASGNMIQWCVFQNRKEIRNNYGLSLFDPTEEKSMPTQSCCRRYDLLNRTPREMESME